MDFSLKQIKALLSNNGMPVENLETVALEICSRHTADIDGIKEQRDNYKKDAETLASVQAELDALKKDPYEVKYTALKEQFNQYKNEQTKKETKAAKENAYKAMLKELGVSEKRLDAVLRVTDLDKIELDDTGAIKDIENIKKKAKDEWSDFITSEATQGAVTTQPPKNTGGSRMSMADIYKKDDRGRYLLNAEERQKAIAANLTQKG